MTHASEILDKNEYVVPNIKEYKNAKEFKDQCSFDNLGENCLECWYWHECRNCCDMSDWKIVFNDLKSYWRKKKLEKLLA